MDVPNADELGKYSQLSNLAILAFALGLFSWLAFVSPLLIVLPVAAVIAALLSLSRISASDGSVSGTGLARWALGLGICFGVGAAVRAEVRDFQMGEQADRRARAWMDSLKEGRPIDALEYMTGSAKSRFVPSSAPGQPAAPFDPSAAADRLAQDLLPAALAELEQREGGTLQRKEYRSELAGPAPRLAIRYEAELRNGGPVVVDVFLVKGLGRDGQLQWLVDSWQLAGYEPAAGAAEHDHAGHNHAGHSH